jgi:hypothetical protein
MLKYTENKNIDLLKWDNTVNNSCNGYIYSTAKYLNIVCENWDALIYNDYEIVMPLPYKKKYGIKYIMQPFFTQQLGIIYYEQPEPKVLNEFYNFLKNSFLYFAINLNSNNNTNFKINKIEKTNLILNLQNSYSDIYSNFSTNTQRNLKKISKTHFLIDIETKNSENFIKFFNSNLEKKELPSTIETLKNLINFAFINKIGEIYTVKENNETLASVFFLESKNRHIYLAASSNNLGKEKKAMFYLVNNFIETHSETNSILDFEGSDIEGVKRFYESFGAKKENYFHVYKKIF